jgi:hypothetical protein
MSDNAENIMDNASSSAPTDTDVLVVNTVDNDNGDIIGYRCEQVVQANTLADVDLVFYVDLAFPTGQEEEALQELQKSLIESVATQYGIFSGIRCLDPPLDGTSWVVQFVSEHSDYTRQTLFGKQFGRVLPLAMRQ